MKIAVKGSSYQVVWPETDLWVVQWYKDGVKNGDPVRYDNLPIVPPPPPPPPPEMFAVDEGFAKSVSVKDQLHEKDGKHYFV